MISPNDELAAVKKLKEIATELHADWEGGEVVFTKNEIKFTMFLFSPAKSSGEGSYFVAPAFLQIRTTLPNPHLFFKIRKSDTFDWISENIFFRPDFQVGDSDFDSKYYIKVVDKAWAASFLAKPNVRFKITSIFLSGFHKLYSEDGELKIDCFIKSIDDCPSIELIKDAIDKLEQIIIDLSECKV